MDRLERVALDAMVRKYVYTHSNQEIVNKWSTIYLIRNFLAGPLVFFIVVYMNHFHDVGMKYQLIDRRKFQNELKMVENTNLLCPKYNPDYPCQNVFVYIDGFRWRLPKFQDKIPPNFYPPNWPDRYKLVGEIPNPVGRNPNYNFPPPGYKVSPEKYQDL